jgi:hypothetical protein
VATLAGASLYLIFTYSARRGVEALGRSLFTALSSANVHDEPLRGTPPILLGRDTVARLISVGHIDNRAPGPDSFLVYIGAWSGGGSRANPSESLAAVDSADSSHVPHELRLVPRTTVGTRQRLGVLRLSQDSILIPVYHAGPGAR